VQAQLDQQGAGGWQLLLSFTSAGQAVWTDYTARHNATVTPNAVANMVAIVVDGKVLSYPEIQATINGPTAISGGFDKTGATDLANALRHGSLPLLLTVTSVAPVN
jgi:preprotein translocase subunit SecD